MFRWEERAQNGIWREAGCLGGRREHRMGFGRRQDVCVGGGSTKLDFAGGRMDGWKEGVKHGIWREEGAQNGIWREAVGCGGKLKAGMGAGKIHCKKGQRFFRPQPGCH